MIGLTPRARELLAYLSEREICPTYREMAAAVGYKSKRSIAPLLGQLEQRGYIRRLPFRQQAIEVLKPAYPPVIINGERYRFIPWTAISPFRSPAGAFPAAAHETAGDVPAPHSRAGIPSGGASEPVVVPSSPTSGAAAGAVRGVL